MNFSKCTKYFFFGAVLITVASACYSPIDGCLDPEATNYSIVGDRDCDDCCTYPTIKLSLFHQYNDTTFFLRDTLVNNLGQQYAIVKFVYLLSDFRIEKDGLIHEVIDSIKLNTSTGTTVTKDDVIRVSRDVFSYNFGTIIYEGKAEKLSFKVGLPALLNMNEFTTPVSGHPLISDPDSLYQEDGGGYVFQRVQVAKGTDLADTVIYDIVGEDMLQEVSFSIDDESVRGKDKTIIIEARYNYWFDEVDFDVMSKEEIENEMARNSANMFRARK